MERKIESVSTSSPETLNTEQTDTVAWCMDFMVDPWTNGHIIQGRTSANQTGPLVIRQWPLG